MGEGLVEGFVDGLGNGFVKGLVSVIMPVHDSEATLEGSVRSVLGQGYADLELIAVDDASGDGSLALLREIREEDPRIKLICSRRNLGVAAARNAGIQHARGQYLAFLDSDDLWRPDKLEHQIAFMEGNGAGFSATAYGVVDQDGNRCGPDRHALAREDSPLRPEDYMSGNPFGCLTVMLDRSRLKGMAIRFPDIKHEDYALWLDILMGGADAYYLDEVLADYRIGRGSMSGNKLSSAAWTWQIYRHHIGLPLGKSLRCFVRYALNGVRKRI